MLGTALLAGAQATKPIPVEFWHVGDDSLSQKLADTVEKAFARSPNFALITGQTPGALIVTIPANVDWKRVDQRTKVLYRVEFSSKDSKGLSKSSGSCWDEALDKCAAQILDSAKIAASKVHKE